MADTELSSSPETLPTADDWLSQGLAKQTAQTQSFGQGLLHAPLIQNPVNVLSKSYATDGPYAGPESDNYFSLAGIGKVLSAFGQGAYEGWGAGQNPDAHPEDHKKDSEIVKGANEAWWRPTGAALAQYLADPTSFYKGAVDASLGAVEYGTRAFQAVGSGFAQATGTLGEEIGGPAGELLKDLSGGALPEGRVEAPVDLNQARAKGVIGEGESGYFDTKPLTPEETETRQAYASEGGSTIPGQPQLSVAPLSEQAFHVPSVDDLARQINPDVFNQIDDIKSRLDYQRNLGNPNRERTQELDYQLRDTIEPAAKARSDAQESLSSQTEYGDQFRDYAQAQALESAIRLQELNLDAQDAFRHAESLLPDPIETAKEAQPTSPDKTSAGAGEGTSTSSSSGEEGTGGGGNGTSGSGFELSEGESKVSGSAQRVSEDSIKKGLTDEGFDNLPEYKGFIEKEQLSKVASLMNDDFEKALSIVNGTMKSPGDIQPQFVLSAMRQHALATNNIDLIRQVARSPLNKELSLGAQTLRASQGVDSLDPAKIIQDLEASRREAAGGLKADAQHAGVETAIKSSIQKAVEKFKPDWDTFLKAIDCGDEI